MPDNQDIDAAERMLIEGAASLGLTLTGGQLQQFRRYFQELSVWNEKSNLTSMISPDDVYTKHFLDSLTVLDPIPGGAATVLDVGSGAGLPGVPLAIAAGRLRVILLE